MKIAIITAIYDGYDTLKPVPPQQHSDTEWICVTDKPIDDDSGWQVIVEPRPGQHPNVAAKRPKMLPWEYTDAHYSIWIDASFRVISDAFAHQAMQLARPIAQFSHPWRDCIYSEAEASKALAKYAGLAIDQQMRMYESCFAHPKHWGLWATGAIARMHCPEVRELGEKWLRDCQEWTYQDQLSQAVHLRALGLRPERFPGTHINNPWLSYEGSARH